MNLLPSSEPGSRRSFALIGLLVGVVCTLGLLWAAMPVQDGGVPVLGDPPHLEVPRLAAAAPLRADREERQLLGVLPQTTLAPRDPVTCTLEITTTDKAPFNNHTPETAASIANYTDQSLLVGGNQEHKPDDEVKTQSDFYRLDNATPGYRYTVQAKPDWTTNYNLGIIVYNRDHVPIITDTNTFDNNFGNVSFVADSFGPYYFEIFQIAAQCSGHTYSLILGSTAPTPTTTPTVTPTPAPETPVPSATWMGGFDQYEPNFDFGLATTIAPNLAYDANFIPWGGGDVDNDFYKIRVKPGLQLTCYTSDLDPGVDPRMVFYNGPGQEHFVMANDDVELGDFNSRLSYYANYEGFVYILVGQGDRMSIRDTANSAYALSCELSVPGQATPLPGQPTPGSKAPQPTAAPTTPSATATPRPTPTPTPSTSVIATPTAPTTAGNVELAFRLVTRPDPVTPTAEPNGLRTFQVLIYFDADTDGQMGAGEGVTGFFVLVVTPDGKRELAQGYTDEQGRVSFTVSTVSTVRVLVPLLGFDRLVDASRPEVRVRIAPPTLPEAIP